MDSGAKEERGKQKLNMREEEREVLKEELKTYIELLKVFSAFVITIGGGLATLFLNLNSKEKVVLFVLGSVVEVFFIFACVKLLVDIYSLIERLKP